VSKYVKKGARVGVVGQLQIDTWIDNDSGEPRSRPKVIVRDLDILETRAEADLRKQGSRGSSFFSDADDDYGGSKASSGGFFDM
jgi:single-stranded DNA-binding protein